MEQVKDALTNTTLERDKYRVRDAGFVEKKIGQETWIKLHIHVTKKFK